MIKTIKQMRIYSTLPYNMLDEFLKEKSIKPVYMYHNLHQDETKKNIKKDLSNLSGVYLIFNNINGDYYIGSASTDRFYTRFSNHLIHFTGSKILKNAVRKYKINNFIFIVLELFPEIVNKENNKKLLDLEDYFLKSLLPNYNILTEAGSSFGYKHTEISRIKMKTNYSIERREIIGNLNKGKNLSQETKDKLINKALGRKIIFSDKGFINLNKRSKPLKLYNLDNTLYGEYPSIAKAAYVINCSPKTIKRALESKSKLLKRRYLVKM